MTDRSPVRALAPQDRLIFPLDLPDLEAALGYVYLLKGKVGYFKIGLELFISQGPAGVREIKKAAESSRIFLDLKLHDIPATVGRAMAAASGLGGDLITVHADGSRKMIEAAKAAAGSAKVLAVTVLTSLDPARDDLGLDPEYKKPGALVRHRAREALAAGADGLVCSGLEAAVLRSEFGPAPLLVTPGIRPAWSLVAGDDQQRVVTPVEAIKAGADLLVIGRPIRDAPDPARAAEMAAEEIADTE